MEALLGCFSCSKAYDNEHESLYSSVSEKSPRDPVLSVKPYADDEDVASKFIETLRDSDNVGQKLCDELNSIINPASFTSSLAERILAGVRDIINNEAKTGRAMREAIERATNIALEFAKEHPFYTALIAAGTIIALGVLVIYAPAWVLEGLGFAARGPRLGSFAARWMSSIAKRFGGVSQGSIYAYLQRLGMVWKTLSLEESL